MKKNSIIIAGIILIIFFILLQPTMRSYWNSPQTDYFTSLRDSIVNKGEIDPQQFWELREFYSRGTYTFSKKGISVDDLPEDFQIIYRKYTDTPPFLLFISPSLVSADALVDQNSEFASDIIFDESEEDKTVLFFVKPLDEMKKANGYFDYNDRDKEFVNGKKWLTVTVIKK